MRRVARARTHRLWSSHVQHAARQLIGRYLSSCNKQSIPVCLDDLATIQHCDVEHTALPSGTHGLLVPGSGRFSIKIDVRHISRTRQRFTLAHEIAHTFFYRHDAKGRITKVVSVPPDEEERLCDAAAGLLTVPRELLCRAVGAERRLNVGTLLGVARRFDVSAEVAARRILDEIPVTTIGFCEWINEETYLKTRRSRFSRAEDYEPFVLAWLVPPRSAGDIDPPRGTRLRKGGALSEVLSGKNSSVRGETVKVGRRLTATLDRVTLVRRNERVHKIVASITGFVESNREPEFFRF